ncbi:MAG: type II toxin-antitoxin system death-on-curing family toxin [Actinobacteria bacterium]|nr:type II toxin-antitoxin system death-on-curing family toxin [Actinomycetota bacterium]
MTNFLDLEDALTLVARLGFFVKDVGLLDSTLARPRASVFGEDAYPSLELKSAAMIHSVIKNHPMVDGNKRTSWLLLNSFLYINGYLLEMSVDKGMELTLGVATDRLTLDHAAKMIGDHMVPLS